jgi:putative ATP-dependent endonuclease of the OLD family
MLDTITIKNFKAIQGEKQVTLSGLSNVNYLVGKNGCGKSSVLEGINLFLNLIETGNICIPKSDLTLEDGEGIISDMKKQKLSGTIPNESWLRSLDGIISKDTFIKIDFTNKGSSTLLFKSNRSILNCYFSHFTNSLSIKEKSFLINLERLEVTLDSDGNYTEEQILRKQNIDISKMMVLNELYYYIKMEGKFGYIANVSDQKFDEIKKYLPVTINDSKVNFNQLSSGKRSLSLIFDGLLDLIARFELSIINIEEPEIYLHAEYQKSLPALFGKISKETGVQFIISTHSNYLISEALSQKDSKQKVYHFDDVGVVNNPEGISSLKINSFNNVLDTLGAKPSDMLFANGIIWVEGPSDAIYIKYWLGLEGIEQGRDYEFSFYGGRILSNCEAENGDKIMKMLKINTKAIVYMDSDKSNESSDLNDTKTRIINEFKNYTDSDIWVSDGREIENYLSEEMLKSYCDSLYKNEKKKYKIIDKKQVNIIDFKLDYGIWKNNWNIEIALENNHTFNEELNKMDLAEYITIQEYSLSEFSNSLESQIKKYAEIIRKWNS